MKATYLFLILLFSYTHLSGQYKIEQAIYRYPGKIDFKDKNGERLLFKGNDNTLYVYSKYTSNDSQSSFRVVKLNLDIDQAVDSFDLPPLSSQFYITDIIPGKNRTLFLSHNRLVYQDRDGQTGTVLREKVDFRSGILLNESLALLYELYNHHPKDGSSGLCLNLYDMKSNKIVRSKVFQFPGTFLGNLTINWVTNDDRFIYAFAGLSGRVFKFDLNLNFISEKDTKLFENETKLKNYFYEQKMDSLVATERRELAHKLSENDTALVKLNYTSTIYSKDFVVNTSNEVRSQYDFIEKVFKTNDNRDEVLLTVSRPGYGWEFRDVYIYNLKTNAISLKFSKWRTGKAKEIKIPEDYFPVYLSNDELIAPYFYKSRIYNKVDRNMRLYKSGLADSLNAMQYEDIIRNGYTFQLVEYTY
ncbi:hypothetical protein VRU48_14950 [Pedobacter sp. KR3-3]|uniref:6-bladed beta-propeller n=1 Tax=Pedobacter albus TaxID=3113905 RepID=A0ABU7IAB4_9SPHI|nr:hypothetical protein [Pedobacter sp. KR3-3]MEE1946420.1 hypothetical protein [Pedobacter sp. KR3-3]